EFMVQAAPVNPGLTGQLVIKKAGSGSLFASYPVTVAEFGQTYVSTGPLAAPLLLPAGQYAFMLYLNGSWSDSEAFNSTELLSFGQVNGTSFETAVTPTPGFSVNFSNYFAHAIFSTVQAPVITATAVPPDGEAGKIYP